MAPRRIQCLVRMPKHPDRLRRVDAVGGIDGGHWRESERTVISDIKRDADSYCVVEDGKIVPVFVKTHDGREYLKTQADRFLPDDALNLRDCPRSVD